MNLNVEDVVMSSRSISILITGEPPKGDPVPPANPSKSRRLSGAEALKSRKVDVETQQTDTQVTTETPRTLKQSVKEGQSLTDKLIDTLDCIPKDE